MVTALWLRIGAAGEDNLACIAEPLIDRRVREAQLTKDWRRMDAGWREVMARFRESQRPADPSLLCQAEAQHDRYIAYLAYEAGDFSVARRFIGQAWRRMPTAMLRDKRAWVMMAAALGSLLPAGLHRSVDGALRRLRGSHA